MNEIIKTVRNTIEEHGLFHEGAHVVLGLSGGPDSMCLFDVLCALREERGITIHAVHVNHMLRGADADRDQEFVEGVCAARGVPLDVTVFDCKALSEEKGVTEEEAGRVKRYEAFYETADKVERELIDEAMENEDEGATALIPEIVVAVAHNYDDQAETIMFRLMRGTGPDGLAGMEYRRQDYRGFDLVRPLLDCRRKDIEAYCEEKKLSPRKDETNGEAVYSRNAIRLGVFPYLEKYSPNFRDALVRLGDIAREDKAFMQGLAEEVLTYIVKEKNGVYDEYGEEESPGFLLLDGAKLRKIAKPVRRRAVSLAAAELGLTEDLTSAHYRMIDDVIFSGNPSAGVDLPHGYRLSNIYEDVRIAAPDVSGKAAPPGKTELVSKEEFDAMQAEDGKLRAGGFAAFDADALELVFGNGAAESAVWRRREPGDYLPIRPGAKSAGGKDVRFTLAAEDKDAVSRKKMQDLLVDDKVPKDDRAGIYYAAIGKEVLFLPVQQGVRRARWSCSYKVTHATRRVLLCRI